MKKLVFLLVIVSFVGCQTSSKSDGKSIWFGGQIINPKGDYVNLYKGEKLIDSIKLDNNNFFLYKNDTLPEGLYTFTHKEFQIFYLKPGDSLMLRVNTMEFDESLTYTGRGADRNNFLMEMFLINENENKLIPSYYSLPPVTFSKKLDSLKAIRKKIYNLYKKENQFDINFDEIARASINYDYYSKKELYTSVNNANAIKYPENFFAYRDSIDFKNNNLQWYFSYNRLLNRYFDNLVFENTKTKSSYYNKNSFSHVSKKIKFIDSLIPNEELKNRLIENNAKRFIEMCNNDSFRNKLLAQFLNTNTNPVHRKKITTLVANISAVDPGKLIPNVPIITIDSTVVNLPAIIKKPTVIYFWSTIARNHNLKIHKKVAELQIKFPMYDFIGINVDSQITNWKNFVMANKFNKNKEYRFTDLDKAKSQLVLTSLNKAFIISPSKIVLENNTNLFSPTIEKLLGKYKFKK